MKITSDISFDDTELELLRQTWKADEASFGDAVRAFLTTTKIETLSSDVESVLRQRFEDDEIAAKPDLEGIKKDIVRSLYLYSSNDKHHYSCLFDILAKLDPGLLRRVTEEGAEIVYQERFSDE